MGLTSAERPLLVQRPFRAPHHTISSTGMAGGGTPVPRPGEISLAHNGVLFLDELPEFHKDVLEVLRQPLEEGWVTISRSAGSERFPARFMLVCAMNPCKCGWYGYGSRCRCSPRDVEKYLGKLSGPLLDRIDLYAEVPPLDFDAGRPLRPGRPVLQRPHGPGGAGGVLRPGRRRPGRHEGGLPAHGPHRPQL